jgi:hypothetical protein
LEKTKDPSGKVSIITDTGDAFINVLLGIEPIETLIGLEATMPLSITYISASELPIVITPMPSLSAFTVKLALPPDGIVREDCVSTISGFLLIIAAFKSFGTEGIRLTDIVAVFAGNNDTACGVILAVWRLTVIFEEP